MTGGSARARSYISGEREARQEARHNQNWSCPAFLLLCIKLKFSPYCPGTLVGLNQYFLVADRSCLRFSFFRNSSVKKSFVCLFTIFNAQQVGCFNVGSGRELEKIPGSRSAWSRVGVLKYTIGYLLLDISGYSWVYLGI